MKTLNKNEMCAVSGGKWHCVYCCQDMGFFEWLFHGIGNSQHQVNKKYNIKCEHAD